MSDFTSMTNPKIEEAIIRMTGWIADGIKSGQTEDNARYRELIADGKAVLARRNRGE